MVLEGFGEPNMSHTSSKLIGALFRGKAMHKGSISFQHRGLIHDSMQTTESGLLTRGSYSFC